MCAMFILLCLRVTLFLLDVSIIQIPAGANCDLQTRGVVFVGQSQLQLSGHADSLREGADAAGTALMEQHTSCGYIVYV